MSWPDEPMFGNGFAGMCKRIEQLEAENAELREWKADVEDSHRRVMSEVCPTDEKHCTCVPILRAEIKRLNDQTDAHEKECGALGSHFVDALKKVAEYERQIASGELVPVKATPNTYYNIGGAKKCPSCKEVIGNEFCLCPNCGYDFINGTLTHGTGLTMCLKKFAADRAKELKP